MSYYNCFVEDLQKELKTSENLIKTYSPNNNDQVYKYNHLEVMQEIVSKFLHLRKAIGNKVLVLKALKREVDEKYKQEQMKLQETLPINRKARMGIAETYYNMSDELRRYISWVERYDNE